MMARGRDDGWGGTQGGGTPILFYRRNPGSKQRALLKNHTPEPGSRPAQTKALLKDRNSAWVSPFSL